MLQPGGCAPLSPHRAIANTDHEYNTGDCERTNVRSLRGGAISQQSEPNSAKIGVKKCFLPGQICRWADFSRFLLSSLLGNDLPEIETPNLSLIAR
jgi:hypothetical protein